MICSVGENANSKTNHNSDCQKHNRRQEKYQFNLDQSVSDSHYFLLFKVFSYYFYYCTKVEWKPQNISKEQSHITSFFVVLLFFVLSETGARPQKMLCKKNRKCTGKWHHTSNREHSTKYVKLYKILKSSPISIYEKKVVGECLDMYADCQNIALQNIIK